MKNQNYKIISIFGMNDNQFVKLPNLISELIKNSAIVTIDTKISVEVGEKNYYYENINPDKIFEIHSSINYFIVINQNSDYNFHPTISINLTSDKNNMDIQTCSLISDMHLKSISNALGISVNITKEIIYLSGARCEPLTAIIMAGGASKRMGTNKALLSVNGDTLLKKLTNSLFPWFDEVLISSGNFSYKPIEGVGFIPDKEKNCGPMMGLYCALSESQFNKAFVISCDIPTINLDAVRLLLSKSENNLIVVPSFQDDFYEPLFAVYTKECLPNIEDYLSQKIYKLKTLINSCNSRQISINNNTWYHNLNTPQDYQKYKEELCQ